MKKYPVVATTSHRGVFFGYIDKVELPENETIELENAMMAVYWPPDNHGVLGLAVEGPKRGAKIGPSVPKLLINHVDALMECTEIAVKQWVKGLWE